MSWTGVGPSGMAEALGACPVLRLRWMSEFQKTWCDFLVRQRVSSFCVYTLGFLPHWGCSRHGLARIYCSCFTGVQREHQQCGKQMDALHLGLDYLLLFLSFLNSTGGAHLEQVALGSFHEMLGCHCRVFCGYRCPGLQRGHWACVDWPTLPLKSP